MFGEVVEGQDVADWIGKTPTGAAGPFPKDVPANPVVIESVALIDMDEGEAQSEEQTTEQKSE